MQRHQRSQHGVMMNERETSHEETEESDSDTVYEESDNDTIDDKEVEEDSDDSEEIEEESDSTDTSDEKEVNIWDVLKGKAVSQLSGETDNDHEDVLDGISEYYTNLLKLYHYTRKDKYHKKIMTTKRRLIDEEEYGPVEAIDAAVKQRRYAISEAAGIANHITDTSMLDKDEHSV